MDKAHKETDRKLEAMENKLRDIYSQARKDTGKEWKLFLKKSAKKIKQLEKELREAKTEDEKKRVKKKLIEAKKKYTLNNKRFKQLSEKYAEEIYRVNETATAYINGELPEIYALNYNATGDIAIKGYSFSLTDAETVRLLATTNKSLLPYKHINKKKDKRWNTKKVNAEVLQGILKGETMDEISQRLRKVTEMNGNSAIRNARTCVTGAENSGRMQSFEKLEKDGIIINKKWVSANDKRTRHWHSELNGQSIGIHEPFINAYGEIRYPADPEANPANVYNCRCTVVADVLGFTEVK